MATTRLRFFCLGTALSVISAMMPRVPSAPKKSGVRLRLCLLAILVMLG